MSKETRMKSKKVSIIALVALMIAITGMGVAGASTTVDVPADPLWTDTGLTVTNGQTIAITASGAWWTGSNTNQHCGPDGDTSVGDEYDLFLTSTAPSKHGELIAFVGPDPKQGDKWGTTFFPQPVGAGYWAIGSSATFTSDRNGKLWLGINDGAQSKAVGDNGGFVATVTTVTGIPEFPTATLPVAAVIGLMFIFGRRKQ